MNPAGNYVNNYLNTGASVAAKYRSIAASFEPTDKKLKPWAKDKLMTPSLAFTSAVPSGTGRISRTFIRAAPKTNSAITAPSSTP